MASLRRNPEPDPRASDDAADAGREAAGVVRRAPFADNPKVGARGQRTQQRILDAALVVFGEEGYDACGIDPIAAQAGCSRAAFYQYFSSKEDVFRELTGQVARQLDASTEALVALTPDQAGWQALRAWVARHSSIYDRYQSVFLGFQAASSSSSAVATGSARWAARAVARIRTRVATTTLPPRELDPVILQLLECVVRSHDIARILRPAAAEAYAEQRIGDALTDVIHRSLFGLQENVNVRAPAERPSPVIRFDASARDAFRSNEGPPARTSRGRATQAALIDAGRKVFAERGYHRTRVADIVGAAEVSHGAFYRYFANKNQLARRLATAALQTVSRVLADIPIPFAGDRADDAASLRRWLHRYSVTQSSEAAMLRVWVDAALQDTELQTNSAAALDWGRRAMVSFLEPRGFGDVETEAVVLVALLSAFGARARTPQEIDAAAHVIERGLLGLGER